MSDAVKEVLDAIDAASARSAARFKALEADIRELEKKSGRPNLGGGSKSESLTPEQEDYRKAFNRFLRKGDATGLDELARKAMNTSTDPDGGYLVMPQMDAMIERIAPTISAMYAIANVQTIGTAKYEKMVKTAGMAMRRVAEGATGGETTEPKFSKVSIEIFPSEVEPWVHNETLEDSSIDLEGDLAQEAGISFAEGAGDEFINGNGVGKARGILAYDKVANASWEWGKVGYVVTGAGAAFPTASTSVNSADPLITLQHALKPQFRNGAVWLMNDATAGVVRKLKDADGRHVWQDSLAEGQPPLLLGHAVWIDDSMPDIGAGAYAIAFLNAKRGYTIVQHRGGTVLIRDPFTSKGITKFNMRRRFGGGISHYQAIKLLRFATS